MRILEYLYVSVYLFVYLFVCLFVCSPRSTHSQESVSEAVVTTPTLPTIGGLGGYCKNFIRGFCTYMPCRFRHVHRDSAPLSVLEEALVSGLYVALILSPARMWIVDKYVAVYVYICMEVFFCVLSVFVVPSAF